ncbi:hypothetical protein ACFSKW_45320 [Nonomuraea mangrovi]|uniref:Tetratricopeptide repeat protein n=1 Tax=Nonomuraea mangrovi TaxID=2316207 RepID=A0ABW4T9L0_9ACTN
MDELDKDVRDELRSLPLDLAELVGSHLVAAERALVEDDPDRAHEHTKVARRFAARIGVVREAAGIVAYRAGNYSEALSDLRAARRMTGSDAYLPIMADCERGMGRPERALDLVRSPEAERLDRAGRIELAIVESGARRDLGQNDAAVITLQRLPELRDPNPRPWSARLAFAYADALADAGHQEAATDWFARALAFDEDGETDAAERYAELTGAVIEDIEEDYEAVDETGEGVDVLADQDALEGATLLDDEGDDEDVDVLAVEEDASEGESDLDLDLDDEDEDEDDDEDEIEDARDEGRGDVLDDDEDIADEAAEAGEPSYAVDHAEGASEVPPASPVDSDDDLDSEDELDSDEDGDSDDDSDAEDDLEADDAREAAEPAGETDDVEEDVDAELDKSSAGTARSGDSESAKPGISPAFIEPDFGDILDDQEEPEAKK